MGNVIKFITTPFVIIYTKTNLGQAKHIREKTNCNLFLSILKITNGDNILRLLCNNTISKILVLFNSILV